MTCKICRLICSSINLEQAMELKCAEEVENVKGSHYGRLEFLGCQLCITSPTKFDVISSRADFNGDLFRKRLLTLLSDGEYFQPEWYSCDGQGRPVEGGKYRSAMLRYAQGPTDYSVEDEICQLLALLAKKGENVKSSNIVTTIISNTHNANTNAFTIDDEIFITEYTWHCLKGSIDAKDRKKFQVIDEEKYGGRNLNERMLEG